MRLQRLKKYALGAGGMLVLATAIVLATGSGSAVAAQISSVFVTNDASHPVPVREQGTANVNVLGTVSTQTALPSNAFSRVSVDPTAVISGPDPTGTHYAITSIVASNDGSSTAHAFTSAYYGPTTDCQLFSARPDIRSGPNITIPPSDTREVTFPQPFVLEVGSGSNACLLEQHDAGVTVSVVGYRF